MGNNLKELERFNHSIWLDYIRRDLIQGGGLGHMIEADGLKGMTSNPAIFEKAIVGSDAYDSDIRARPKGGEAFPIYDALSRADVAAAADAFLPVYRATGGVDGYVSLEVNPHLARDTRATVEEGRRLWKALGRPNVHIKVPATREGLPAVEALLAEGINVNVTLIFSVSRYLEVADAYAAGLERLAASGKPVSGVNSVASFFVSRIDAAVDPLLAAAASVGPKQAELAAQAKGKTAIACARLAYQAHLELRSQARFRRLADQGARIQRLLWASTGTKDPSESDVKYVEALIGPDTVDTAPLETLEAFRDHGKPEARLESGLPEARALLQSLPGLGVDLEKVAQRLEEEGLVKFNQPFDKLLATIAQRAAS